MSRSRYALKRSGSIEPTPQHVYRRKCTSCGRVLTGKKGHGFVTPNGKGVECQPGCGIPKP